MADISKAKAYLLSVKQYVDLALAELPDDPAYQDPKSAAEQATDAIGQLEAAVQALAVEPEAPADG